MTAIFARDVVKTFDHGKRIALNHISTVIPEGKITGIVGPDGAGKTTLLRIFAGLMHVDSGACLVFGFNTEQEAEKIQQSLGYLPQKFGLYEDLSVLDNLSLYADLQGVPKDHPIFQRLLDFSGLAPFQKRLAGNLSGGMKQKLGLMSTLLKKPKLLLLDEPTVGVDPLSQQELWKMIFELKEEMTIITTTSYLHEAERCDHTILLNEGHVLYEGPPALFTETVAKKTFFFTGVGDIKRQLLDQLIGKHGIIDTIVEGDNIRVTFKEENPDRDPKAYSLNEQAALIPRTPNFEDAFISHLGGVPKRPALHLNQPFQKNEQLTKVIEAKNLTRTFDSFKAVDNVSFSIDQGEIFGLLGPNGAGKSTTFKMLCGLLTPTQGEALIKGVSLQKAPTEARNFIGYMAQKFSLYGNLTLLQNLNFFAGIYPVEDPKKSTEEMISIFDLEAHKHSLAADLPLGYKQRLALSCSLMHQPSILFLDEPTSGVDPLTRREFWHQINLLAASGMSIMVSTHLMDEAEFCDRIGLIYRGKLKMIGTPDELKKQVPKDLHENPSLTDAFLYFCSENGKQEAM